MCACVSSKAIFLTFAKALQCIEPDAAAAWSFTWSALCALDWLAANSATGCHRLAALSVCLLSPTPLHSCLSRREAWHAALKWNANGSIRIFNFFYLAFVFECVSLLARCSSCSSSCCCSCSCCFCCCWWPFVLFALWLNIICFTFGFVGRVAAFYANSYQLAAANGQLGKGS